MSSPIGRPNLFFKGAIREDREKFPNPLKSCPRFQLYTMCSRILRELTASSLFLEGEGDVARVSAGMFDQNFAVASLDHVGKLFAPFHQQDGVFVVISSKPMVSSWRSSSMR